MINKIGVLVAAVVILCGVAFAGVTNFDSITLSDSLIAPSATITSLSTGGIGVTSLSVTNITSTIEGVLKMKPMTTAEAFVYTGSSTKEGTFYINSTTSKEQIFIGGTWKTVRFE